MYKATQTRMIVLINKSILQIKLATQEKNDLLGEIESNMKKTFRIKCFKLVLGVSLCFLIPLSRPSAIQNRKQHCHSENQQRYSVQDQILCGCC